MNHITQDAARAIFSEVTKAGKGFATTQDIMNAAIQHYIDQRAKEFPVLPDVPSAYDESGYIGYSKSDIQEYAKAYGAACAAHAREVLARQYRHELDKLGLRNYELRKEIDALKGK